MARKVWRGGTPRPLIDFSICKREVSMMLHSGSDMQLEVYITSLIAKYKINLLWSTKHGTLLTTG
jgi:hypothetical protein